MPPILFASLQLPFTQLGHALFPAPIANGIISGAFTFCMSKLLLHWYMLTSPFAAQMCYTIACITRMSRNALTSLSSKFPCDRLHHTTLPKYLKDMKKYHLAHHYKNFELGFGVTSCVFVSPSFLPYISDMIIY